MMMVMVVWRRRRLPDAAHQRQGASDAPSADAPAGGGGARRHPAALKHPEEPYRHVRLSDTLIPRREKRILRAFPALPAIHPCQRRLANYKPLSPCDTAGACSSSRQSFAKHTRVTRVEAIRRYRSAPADLSPRSYRPCTMPRYARSRRPVRRRIRTAVSLVNPTKGDGPRQWGIDGSTGEFS